MKSTLESVKKKIIEAVPEIFSENCPTCGYDGLWNATYTEDKGHRPIQLADVLMAIDKNIPSDISLPIRIAVDNEGFITTYFEDDCVEQACYWDLRQDLDNQPQEVIDFLNELLSNK